MVDLSIEGQSSDGDALQWWRAGIVRADGTFVAVAASTVARMRCESGGEGVKIVGDAGPARVETHLCNPFGRVCHRDARAARDDRGRFIG